MSTKITARNGAGLLPDAKRLSQLLSKLNIDNISYQTLTSNVPSGDGTFCAMPKPVRKSKERQQKSEQICPIANAPNGVESDKCGIPSERDMLAFRLQRQLRHRELQVHELAYKLSLALEALVSQEQFFADGMQRDVWESYDQLMKRRSRIRAVRELIMQGSTMHKLDEKNEEELLRQLGIE